MNFITKWFIKNKLESIQKDLQKESPMSPKTKTTLIFVGALVLQFVLSYLQTDTTPTVTEGVKVVVYSLISAVLFWMKSGRLPDATDIQKSLINGNILIHNDDPEDPVELSVNGNFIPKTVVANALVDNVQISK